MKIREGFVSNSSSSSFILNHNISKEIPKFTVKQVEDNLKGLFDLFDKQFKGQYSKVERKAIHVQKILGKDYKEKYKNRNIDGYILDKIKDDETYIEIYDDYDNTFPFPTQDWIERLFSADKLHLG